MLTRGPPPLPQRANHALGAIKERHRAQAAEVRMLLWSQEEVLKWGPKKDGKNMDQESSTT